MCGGGATHASGWRSSAPPTTRRRVLARFAELPQIVALIEHDERRALGVTVEGVPVELVAAEPERFGTALMRATGTAAYVAALEPLPDAPDERGRLRRRSASRGARRSCARRRSAASRRRSSSSSDIRGDLHCHTTWSDGRASVEEMGRAARERGYEYLAICDHTPAVGAVTGLTADEVRRQAEEIAAANEVLAPFRVLRGTECDILPDGRLDLPDDVLAELDWVQASVHGGQRMPRARDDEARRGGAAQPACALPQPSEGPAHQPPPGERARPRPRLRVALEEGVALEVNGLPDRLDLSGEHVRAALAGRRARSCARPTRTR